MTHRLHGGMTIQNGRLLRDPAYGTSRGLFESNTQYARKMSYLQASLSRSFLSVKTIVLLQYTSIRMPTSDLAHAQPGIFFVPW